MSIDRRLLALVVVFAPGLVDCRSVDIVATRVQGEVIDADATADATADASADASADAQPDAGAAGYDQQGPRKRVGDNSLAGTQCPDGTAPARAFIHAICVCDDYAAGNTLLTDAVNSSDADFPSPTNGGSVGINGYIGGSGVLLQIGGSLLVAGPFGVTISPSASATAHLQVGEDMQLAGALQGPGCSVQVQGDARVGGRIDLQDLSVGGSLFMPEGFEIIVEGTRQVGSMVNEPVQVQPPCGCAPEDLVDIAAEVAAHESDNDNELLDFDTDELDNYQGRINRQLPCGRFYLRKLTGQGNLELSVKGRAALYIQEQVNFEGPVSVQLQPGAELDLFFADTVTASEGMQLGSATGPERVRLYIGGSGTVQLHGPNLIAGHLYAPRAELVTTGPLVVYGSVFVRRAAPGGELTVHYDQNPMQAGQPCL